MRGFLLYLAGARRDVLDHVPHERFRFLGLGLSILFSGGFTALVAAIAFTQVKVNVILAAAGGCLLGLIFVLLDSQVAASAVRGSKISAAAPRVVLALLSGTIFSMVIAIATFGPEVDQQLAVIKQRAQAEFSQQQSSSPLEREIRLLRNESDNLSHIIATGGGTTLNPSTDPALRSLENQLKQAHAAELSAYANWQCQLYGTSVNGARCTAGNGALAHASQEQYLSAKDRVAKLNEQIALREAQLTSSDASARHARLKEAQQQLSGVNLELNRDTETLAAQDASFSTDK